MKHTTKPTKTASARPENVRGEYKGKRWDNAREKAQAIADKAGATFYAFPEYDGTIAIEIDYPKSGVYFETFKPTEKRTIPAEKPTAIKTQDDWLNAYVKLEAQRNEAQAQAAQLAEALREIDLRTTQARIASGICKRKNQTEFLLGELERIKSVAIAAIAEWRKANEEGK